MSRRTLLKIAFAAASALGVYATLLLAHDYVLALLGRQQEEWQIAFEVAPLPILLGLLSLAIALLARPRFPAVLLALCLGIIVLPALLYCLVSMRIY